MPITIRWRNTATGLDESFSWLDDADTDRILKWAKDAYPTRNPDGTTQPATVVQATRRAGHSWINGMKDATRKAEKDKNIADVPEPPPISVVEPPA